MAIEDARLDDRTPGRRALLARKGEVLYARSCGTRGRGGCVEGFVAHQLRVGNEDVVVDVLRFLEGRLALLRADDPEGLRAMTEGLVGRIRARLGPRGRPAPGDGVRPGGRS